MAVGDNALSEAIEFYTEWVYRVAVKGKGIPKDEWDLPLFSYLLTKKQFSQLNVVCSRNGWPRQTCRGITIYPHNIKHILTARITKNSLRWDEVAKVLAAALNSKSTVSIKKDQHQQVVVLNSTEVLKVGPKKEKYWGALILQVSENDLAPKTAYNANEAKVRAIHRDMDSN